MTPYVWRAWTRAMPAFEEKRADLRAEDDFEACSVALELPNRMLYVNNFRGINYVGLRSHEETGEVSPKGTINFTYPEWEVLLSITGQLLQDLDS